MSRHCLTFCPLGGVHSIDAELNKRYAVEGLLTELEKIKIMVLPDGEKITAEITKRQPRNPGPVLGPGGQADYGC